MKQYIQGLLFPPSDNIKRIKLMCEKSKTKKRENVIYSFSIKDFLNYYNYGRQNAKH
jgi:hypothetical protein